ncbi:hypothetical protein ACQEVC_34190 [Plantactinospora sp. CA-294935]|uniref:hypothetical protein n=1 Tax=Plantactinospora sp. CA-294935 TaxID=3240012 RepID=UPI003D944CA3
MGCNCGAKRQKRVYVLSYEDGSGRRSSEHTSKTDAVIADVRNGGGGVIRPVDR